MTRVYLRILDLLIAIHVGSERAYLALYVRCYPPRVDDATLFRGSVVQDGE